MLAALYDQIGEVAFSLAARIVGNSHAAEQVVEAAFAKTQAEPSLPSNRRDAEAWVLLHVRRQALARRQANLLGQGHNAVRDLSTADLPGSAAGRIPTPLADVELQRLRMSLSTLPPQTREAIELTFFDALTDTELAARLGTTVDAVRTQVHTGLRTLRDSTGVPS